MKTEDITYMLVQDQRGTAMKRLISLLAAATAVVMFALPGLAQTTVIYTSTSYTWQIDCSGAAAGGLGVGTGVNWVWLHNGVQISSTPYGLASCATPYPSSGSGLIPASIDGIQVNGIAVTLSVSESPAGCEAFASVTKSFDPSNPKISISASVSAPAKSPWCPNNSGCSCPKASFHFSLKT